METVAVPSDVLEAVYRALAGCPKVEDDCPTKVALRFRQAIDRGRRE